MNKVSKILETVINEEIKTPHNQNEDTVEDVNDILDSKQEQMINKIDKILDKHQKMKNKIETIK